MESRDGLQDLKGRAILGLGRLRAEMNGGPSFNVPLGSGVSTMSEISPIQTPNAAAVNRIARIARQTQPAPAPTRGQDE